MKKHLVVKLIVVFFVFQISTGLSQDLSQYDSLKEPRITTMPLKQNMLVVEAKGDPNVIGKDVFPLLFKTFFSLKGVKMAPPRARWANLLSTPKNEWVGLYALPLPDHVKELPSAVEGVRIEHWNYGEVAEILHVGSYSEEAPTIEKLHRFIEEKGYKIAGPHEEEYLKAPGMGAKPSEYKTIIRYQVEKK